MYTRIRIPSGTLPLVETVVREAIDPRLNDVHAMLRLPLAQDGLTAGCNFSIADVLFGVIEGVSAALFPRYDGAMKAFTTCIDEHYHADAEPMQVSIAKEDIPALLYTKFRSPMQHALGLAITQPDNQGIRWPDRQAKTLWVIRDKPQLSESDVELLEQDVWPQMLHRPTLSLSGDKHCLSVEAFYVGTRRLIASVLRDSEQMRYANASLASILAITDTMETSLPKTPPPQPTASAPITMVNSGASASYSNTFADWK